MKFRALLAAAALVAAPTLIAAPALADEAVPQIFTAEESNLALGGYDAVSYFGGTPVAGTDTFTTTHKGAVFQFASQENLDAFTANPAKYEPAYGGHCAWGAANGAAYPGDPKVYAIVDGRLFLNYNAEVQEGWNKDQAGFIKTADKKWPGVLNPQPAAAHGS